MDEYVKEYVCEENDNDIKIVLKDTDNGKEIDELWIGCHWLPSDGWSVIGFTDLCAALAKAGYKIEKDNSV